jgi:hypothetical protein
MIKIDAGVEVLDRKNVRNFLVEKQSEFAGVHVSSKVSTYCPLPGPDLRLAICSKGSRNSSKSGSYTSSIYVLPDCRLPTANCLL